MKSLALMFLISILTFANIFCATEDEDEIIRKGLECEENPGIPYSYFLEAQKILKQRGIEREFEHMKSYSRPNSFKEAGIFESKIPVYYMYFASYGYCYPETVEAGQCCANTFNPVKDEESEGGWTVIATGRSSGVDTHNIYTHNKNTYSVLKSDRFKKVVITFPGTIDTIIQLGAELINSALVDTDLNNLDRNIKIGKYFNARSSALVDFIFSPENLAKMSLSDGYQVIFTGHSLGGAMAAATLIYAIDKGYIKKDLNKPVVITYGQPRVGNEAFALALNYYAEVIYRVVNDKDLVTQIPLYGNGYRHGEGKIPIGGDQNSWEIEPYDAPYDIYNIVDEQEYSTWTIIKYLATDLNRHTTYFTKILGGLCSSDGLSFINRRSQY